MSQSHVQSESFTHHHESYIDRSDTKAPQPPTDQNQEESESKTDIEVITVIPVGAHQQPEIMNHQHEFSNQSPPLTSDNTKDLQELDLDLPEYVPFEHTYTGDIQAAESNVQRETRPFPKPSLEEEPQAHSVSAEIQQKQEASFIQTQHENEQGQIQQTKNINEHLQNSETTQKGGEITSEEKLEEVPSNYHGGKMTYEVSQNITTGHHNIQGRPQAPQGELEGVVSEEENGMHSEVTKTNAGGSGFDVNSSGGHDTQSHQSTVDFQTLHKQQINYETLIEELIQLESIPGHQAIDKCEEKIQEFLEILKYQQEQGFGRNQQELQRLHQTLIEQAQERSKELANPEETTLPPTSFWRRVQKKIKSTYDSAKDKAKEVIG